MKKKDDPKDCNISARFTEHEDALVKAEAARRNMTLSDLVRSALLQQRPESSTARLSEIETRLSEQDQTIFDLVTAVNQFRKALVTATEAILLSNEPNSANHPAIRAWVKQQIALEDAAPDDRSEGG